MKFFKSNLEKATETFEELNKVNKDIEEINAFAKALVNGEIKSNIQLLGEEHKEEEKEPSVPEDSLLFSFLQGMSSRNSTEKTPKHYINISHNLNEKLTLEVLAVLIKAKEEYKAKLVKQLKRYGLKV